MKTTSVKLYSLPYNEAKTYWVTILFIMGNVIFPRLCHLFPQGGITWLPIYFFTLVGAYKYGWKVGLLTAVFSPTINSLFFGMPLPAALPVVLMKSVGLAAIAGWCAHRFKHISLPILIFVVFSYQFIGIWGEWLLMKDFFRAVQDFRIGLPGIGLQVFGGYLFIKHLINK
ncbi:ECF transporter S component [Gabonibacter chumensis]|uniref:ECF transporter S component n=1 Tax=Gabonibacter chumensis TaxID=2972474 RepID=UPI002574126B|nr:ECF transporter S component [Gabonibacter chumensis]MCR9011863.1 ECF transporter S component [Gabonibacter chumensis]